VFLVAPLAPRLIVRFGLVRTILTCVIFTLGMLLLLPVFPNVYAWFPIRLTLGVGTSTLFMATGTWANQIAREESRGRVVGLYGLLWSAGFATGPVIIGVTGTEGWVPFVVAATLVAVAAAPIPLARELAPVVHPQAIRRSWRLLWLAPAAMLSGPLLGATEYSLDSFLPAYGLARGVAPHVAVSLLSTLLVGVTAAQYPAGWLSDLADPHRMLFAATALGFTACIALVVLPLGAPIILLFTLVSILGAALGGIWTIAAVLFGRAFRGGDLVAAYALGSMLHGIGTVAGPPSMGAAVDRWGAAAVPLGVAFCCLLFLPVALWRREAPLR
jgi:MFS family permease